MTADPAHWGWAAALALLWLGASLWWLRPRRPGAVTQDATLVLHASQTGQALEIAQATARRLAEGGHRVALLPLGEATAEMIAASAQVLVIVSTTGTGEPPDEARAFAKRMDIAVDLSGVEYAVLALGDRKYPDFCAFGRQVDNWFARGGATALHPRIDLDDLDADGLHRWDAMLDGLGAVAAPPPAPLHQDWRIIARDLLNPAPDGMADVPCLWRVRLAPADDVLPPWQAGDLFEVMTPGGHRRDYSIASLPEDDAVTLLVRAVRGPDGRLGEGSGLLTAGVAVEDLLSGRLRDHATFHRTAGTGPLLLVAAGSGLAGIRPHAVEAMRAGRPVWIILGERRPDIDARTMAEVQAWDAEGRLHRLDLAFSRLAEGRGRYVQQVVGQEKAAIARFLREDGAVMLCGGLAMGKDVEAALDAALGTDWIERARADGRYRADFY